MSKLFKNPYFIAFVVLCAALVIAFSNVVFLGKTLTTSGFSTGTLQTGPYLYKGTRSFSPVTDPAASAWHFEPAMQLNSQAYKNGELPLWNPYNGGGQPLAGDMQSSSFNPIALPVLINPSPAVWDFFLLFRLFLAGFLTFTFLRLINIKTAGALAGAITFMLSGYLMFFVNMAHLNVEILIPLMLIATELLHRQKNLFSLVVLAISSALVVIGGMPESAIVNFGFATVYFIYRTYYEYKVGARHAVPLLKPVFQFSLAMVAGILISTMSWAPFLQYSQIFWSKHSYVSGLKHLSPLNTMQFLAPLSAGVDNITYFGVVPLFLTLVARKEHELKWFFSIAALVIVMKIFGLAINWLGYLPLINRIFIFKYGQALLAICLAVLTAMAVDNGLKTKLWRVILVSVAWVAALYFFLMNVAKIFNVGYLHLYYYTTRHMKFSLVFLGLAIILTLAAKYFRRIQYKHLAIIAVALIFLDLWTHVPPSRADRHDPYIAPPFVKFLQSEKGLFRTYATDPVLWPNINAPFKIQDIRSVNAIQPMDYMNYLSLFNDLRKFGHITGMEGVNLDSQFFDALNVRYVLTTSPLQNNLNRWLDYQKIPKAKINDVIWFKAPFSAKFKIPRDVRFLNFSSSSQWKQKLDIRVGRQLITKETRAGQNNNQIDISAAAGKEVRLRFQADVLLGAFHYSNGQSLSDKFKPVFTDNKVGPPVTVYENQQTMRRVILYDKVKYSPDNNLSKLKSLNIRKEALITAPVKLNGAGRRLKYQAKITSYKPQQVSIKIKTNKEALLVLADTYYPGWTVYVDGKEKEIIKANYMFRGVVIGPSAKRVVFSYEPSIYRVSFRFAGLSLLAMFALGLISTRQYFKNRQTVK